LLAGENIIKKEIEIILLTEAEEYFNNLPQKVVDKFTISFSKTEHGYRGAWFEKLNDTNDIFEFRQRDIISFIGYLPFGMVEVKIKH